ncbi:MAG: PorT family protein [Crocinitomicaceae bacterium]|nr:PorT family protein [Crocinitomicaceae bacterium]
MAGIPASTQIIYSTGLKAGLSIATQKWFYSSIHTFSEKKFRSGFYTAVISEAWRGRYLSFAVDIAYTQKGSKEEIEQTAGTGSVGNGEFVNYYNRFHFISVCPMLKVRHEKGNLSACAMLGPRMERLLAYQSDMSYTSFEDKFRHFIWGINYSIGFEYRMKNWGVSVDIQRQVDFQSLLDTKPTKSSYGIRIDNICYSFSSGLKYYFKPGAEKLVE